MLIENVGQFAADVRFQVWGADCTIWLTQDALWFTFLDRRLSHVPPPFHLPIHDRSSAAGESRFFDGLNLRVSFDGASPRTHLEPFGRLDTHVSYLVGTDRAKWRTDVPVWRGVRYKDLYPGIDLEISGEGGHIVARMVTRPGAKLDAVRLSVAGADRMTMEDNLLRLHSAVGEYLLPLFEVRGAVSELPSLLISGNQVIAPFTHGKPARTEQHPVSGERDLLYATFLGGWYLDSVNALAIDEAGAAYVAGKTESPDFPTVPGAFTTSKLDEQGFAAKVDPTGSSLEYATILGGNGPDGAFAVAVDGDGAAYVGGSTASVDFPTTPQAFDPTPNGGADDAFLVKLNSTGSDLIYGTFLGGSGMVDMEVVWDIAVDGERAAYMTGWTPSFNFPITAEAYDPTFNGDRDLFVVKLDPTGSTLAYSTFLGGDGAEKGYGLRVDATGEAYVAGYSGSPTFPVTDEAYDTSINGCTDAIVLRLNVTGSDLIYSTFVGGSDCDYADGLAIDGNGAAYITGETRSADLPTTSGSFDTTYNGDVDGFVVKLDAAGSALVFCTYLGGCQDSGGWADDAGWAIAVDQDLDVYVTGGTRSVDFPATGGAFDPGHNGYFDTFVVKLTAPGSALAYGTFLGGSELDQGLDIATDAGGTVYIGGETESAEFPTTPSAFDTGHNGYSDGFVASLSLGDKQSHYLYLPVTLRNQ